MKFVVFLIFSVILITSADELRKFALILSRIYTKHVTTTAKDFQICHRKDPDFNKCLGRALENALVSLKNGRKKNLRHKFQVFY